VGPDPTNRGKPGSKRHVITDRPGIPLAALLHDANRHDSRLFERLLDAVPPIRRSAGQRRTRPRKLHADNASDLPRCRQALRARRIMARIARKGHDSRTRLGRHRWVIARTMAWLKQYRRLTLRYERRDDIHPAFLSLGCALICGKFLQHA
jgi:transposase